ncbi:hypothetical protein E0Z10_g10394 [Xylaria hypoxylon]|uniref:Uncharacterized protein n=1 Tax=Xylaria hypoxylon TaxID=37992 RepID=A0A4Z0YL39_9PEZI|nr:hypothetical protein E0Z10_g10394 [Xylaria hypoxylon]
MPDMSQLASNHSNPTASRGHAHVPGSQSQPVSGSQSQSRNQAFHDSSNDSQATNSASNDTDRVFTPPESDSESSNRRGNGNSSSQESQLMQLSNLAALQQKIVVSRDDAEIDGTESRKRMADGFVKHTRHHSSASPVRMGHSRNTSTVSVASTTSSRIGELSAELKAKLSYAMVKVNNGWQSHSIDEVESLASQAASPASSTSTLHGRHGSSASPRISLAGFRQAASNPSSMATSPIVQHSQGRTYESYWRESISKIPSTTSPVSQVPSLAPPASIQPRQALPTNPRRNSNARYTPAYLSQSHHSSPHTPSQPSPLQSTPSQHHIRTPNVDPILFSPPQNLREQEALETLLFMSSPGNSANLKHTFPTPQASQPRNGTRAALPTSRLGQTSEVNSQGRRALPTGRPHVQPKRVEFEKSPSTFSSMDVDEHYGSSQVRAMPRRRTINGSVPRPSLSIPVGLSGPARTKPPLGDDDVQRMIDRAAAADSSDSEGEIQLPPSSRRNGTGVGAL